jgi:hypothetical protein
MRAGAHVPSAALRRALGAAALVLALALARAAPGQVDPFDQVDQALSFSGWNDELRVRVSGTLDLEGYYLTEPSEGLIFSDAHMFFNPRLSLFLDAQLGAHLYAFVQSRWDNGFDPEEPGPPVRLDEYALRLTPFDDGRLSLQVGKFATVVGNWTLRHGSWENPFITAPLPYENLTGIWDSDAVRSVPELMAWAGVLARPDTAGAFFDQYRNIPVIWGPSYATGASVFGQVGYVDYAFEVKNTSLSSRPQTWAPTETQWQNPTFSGRVGFIPDEMWNIGFSASAGPYLQPEAEATLAPGRGLDSYLELVLGQDASFAWHHVQLWAEAYEARFEIPGVGNADTLAYYVEAKYKLTPQLSGALRWNQQLYSSMPLPGGGAAAWSRAIERIDAGPAYRVTAHVQLKLQYSLERQDADIGAWSQLVAVQITTRF